LPNNLGSDVNKTKFLRPRSKITRPRPKKDGLLTRPRPKITRTTNARNCPYLILLPFGLYAFYNPTPCPRKLTCRYIFYVELYSGVILFSLIFRVRVRVSYRVRI